MKILKQIIGFIADPFRKITGLINVDKFSRFFTKRLYLIYLVTAVCTTLLALAFYIWMK